MQVTMDRSGSCRCGSDASWPRQPGQPWLHGSLGPGLEGPTLRAERNEVLSALCSPGIQANQGSLTFTSPLCEPERSEKTA